MYETGLFVCLFFSDGLSFSDHGSSTRSELIFINKGKVITMPINPTKDKNCYMLPGIFPTWIGCINFY